MTIDPNMPLEILNGAGMVVEAFFLLWMARYIWLETGRRQLTWRTWASMRLPPSMNFAISVIVFDFGVWLRSTDVWVWRRFYGSHDFMPVQTSIFAIGAFAIVMGSLCKIRAITKPDFGNIPWTVAAAATVTFIMVSMFLR